jgi:hypothetical protein
MVAKEERQSYDKMMIMDGCVCVGDKRADGRGTDGPDTDGFVLVKAKDKRKAGNVLCPSEASLWPGTERAVEVRGFNPKKNKLNQYDKIVSRDHSLETIQLMK